MHLFWTRLETCLLSNLIALHFGRPTCNDRYVYSGSRRSPIKAPSPTTVYQFLVYSVVIINHTCTCTYLGYTFTLTSPGKSNQKEEFGMAFLPLFFRTKIWNKTPPIRYTKRRLKNLTKERKKPVFNHIYEYLTHQIIAKNTFVHMYLYSS